jgi:hypothetical protein
MPHHLQKCIYTSKRWDTEFHFWLRNHILSILSHYFPVALSNPLSHSKRDICCQKFCFSWLIISSLTWQTFMCKCLSFMLIRNISNITTSCGWSFKLAQNDWSVGNNTLLLLLISSLTGECKKLKLIFVQHYWHHEIIRDWIAWVGDGTSVFVFDWWVKNKVW